jgi:hypothetical protein
MSITWVENGVCVFETVRGASLDLLPKVDIHITTSKPTCTCAVGADVNGVSVIGKVAVDQARGVVGSGDMLDIGMVDAQVIVPSTGMEEENSSPQGNLVIGGSAKAVQSASVVELCQALDLSTKSASSLIPQRATRSLAPLTANGLASTLIEILTSYDNTVCTNQAPTLPAPKPS